MMDGSAEHPKPAQSYPVELDLCPGLGKEKISWTFSTKHSIIKIIGLVHDCFYIPMSQKFLNRADVVAVHEQVSGLTCPQ